LQVEEKGVRIRNDMPQVKVFNGNIESALRIFRRRVDTGGILSALRRRKENPSRAGRKRYKQRLATKRLQKKGFR